MNWVRWTAAEKDLVRQIYASELTVDEQMHLLPGRTVKDVCAQARSLGLLKAKPLPLRDRIIAELKRGQPKSCGELAAAQKGKKKFIRQLMNRLCAEGLAHIHAWTDRYIEPIYVCGPGQDAPKPAPRTQLEYMRRRLARQQVGSDPFDDSNDEELDWRHSSVAEWWPRADAVVTAAFKLMVMVGRAAA
ncbi:hypothetical protein GCT13_13365 [Paraburkholderia sp. CNPSo 3157]|uniref:Uncharacterized protein n=1 Tax=Paraburkholderia franconis TaxID=2654983 RepID=A0A7X1N9V1_9BURK|nr:hypothetical protein [Paraburkholderia franconis]MPW17899.1 hypothetical protein [Paraburkholderia franconis]